MEILLLLIAGFSLMVAAFADSKGRSGVKAFFLSFLLSPLVGFIVVAVLQNKKEIAKAEATAAAAAKAKADEMKSCPKCGEDIRKAAVVCRFCRNELATA